MDDWGNNDGGGEWEMGGEVGMVKEGVGEEMGLEGRENGREGKDETKERGGGEVWRGGGQEEGGGLYLDGWYRWFFSPRNF